MRKINQKSVIIQKYCSIKTCLWVRYSKREQKWKEFASWWKGQFLSDFRPLCKPSLLGRRVVQNYIYVLSIKRKDRDKLWHCSTAKGIRAHFQTSQGEKFKWFNTWEETGLVVTNSVLLNYWKTIGKTTCDKQNGVDCVVLGFLEEKGHVMRSGSANLHTISRQFSYNFAKSWLFVEFLQRSLRCGILIKSAVHQCPKK